MTTCWDIVQEAREYLGTPWKHQARVKGLAVDCIGLIGGVAVALGLPGGEEWMSDPRLHNYGRTPDPEVLLAGCNAYLDPITIADAWLGDVLIMRARRIIFPTHFAIISRVDPIYIIHSRLEHKVAENRLDEKTANLVLYAFRYRGTTCN